VALKTHRDLADQLSASLGALDAAIRTRLPELGRRQTRRRLETARSDKGLRGAVVAALRWFTGSAGSQPTVPRARSAHA